jgi:hypothetical protein
MTGSPSALYILPFDHRASFEHGLFGWTDVPSRPLYELLAEPPFAARIDWSRVHVFWGDERCVPPDLPDESVPAPILSTAIGERFASRGEGDFANLLLSALRFEFSGHEEKRP